MARVLITEAGGRNTIAAIRSLGMHGIEVVCGDETKFSLGFFSKFCKKGLIYPSPKHRPDEWVAWLIKELSSSPYDMVMPIGDDCFSLIARNKDVIGRYTKVALPDYSTWLRARDKAETLKLAMEYNVPHPHTWFVDDLKQIEAIGNESSYPLVIKPKQSSGSRGIVYVHTKDELLENYNRIHALYPFPMIQEFIPQGGNAYGVFLLFNKDSEARAVFAHKRLREFPVKGGPSTLRESVLKPELVNMSIKLLKALNWYGVAMVEFKEDPRDGQCKLMEINPRFWGSLQLSVLSGVDFPYLLYKIAVNGDVEPVMDYPEGVRCRWLLPGDILHFLTNPKRFSMNPGFFNFSKNNRHDDFVSWKDPGPTFGFFLIALVNIFNIKLWKHVFFRG